MIAFSYQLSAISFERSAISCSLPLFADSCLLTALCSRLFAQSYLLPVLADS